MYLITWPILGVEDSTGRTLYHNGVAESKLNGLTGPHAPAWRTGNTLVMLTDVTWYQELQTELEAQNASLKAARRELAEQTDALERQAGPPCGPAGAHEDYVASGYGGTRHSGTVAGQYGRGCFPAGTGTSGTGKESVVTGAGDRAAHCPGK